MFGKNLPRQRTGKRITVRQLNAPNIASEALSRLRISGPGVTQTMVAGIPLVRMRKPETSGSQIAQFKITSGIAAATWSGGVPTVAGIGNGHQITGIGSVAAASVTIKNLYPDAITVTAGKAKVVSAFEDNDGVWWLVTPSCTEVSAS